jgi:hypothetical protein
MSMYSPPVETTPNFALANAEQAIVNHPGYKAFVEWDGLKRTLTVVHFPNHHEVAFLLHEVSSDPATAMSLVPAAPDGVADALFDRASRLLFNYLASTGALVDHSRRLMAMYEGTPLFDDYTTRRANLSESLEAQFMKGLRNFAIHRSLPPMQHRLQFVAEPPSMTSELGLSTSALLLGKWERSEVREFIEATMDIPGQVDLRPLVTRHGEMIRELYNWLFPEFEKTHGAEMAEVNELIANYNVILTGAEPES